jgi:MFS transporter, DHA1 family, multidrug resistance protein
VSAGAAGGPPSGAPGTLAAEEAAYPFWRRNMWVLFTCNLLSNAGFTLYFPFLPLVLRELGAGERMDAWTGYTTAVLYGVTMTLMPLWGSLADHYGKRSMMLRATIGQCLGFTALAFAPDLGALLLGMAWIGASNGFTAASQTLVATNTPTPALGRALSIVQTGSLVGGTLGPVLGGLLALVLPRYQWLFIVGGVTGLASTLLIVLRTAEERERPRERLRLHLAADLRTCLRVPAMGLMFYLLFLFASTFFGSTTVVSLYTLELLGGRGSFLGLGHDLWLSIVTVSLTLSSAAALPAWGRLLDRYEPRRVTLAGLGLCLLAVSVYPLVRDPLQLTALRLVLGAVAVGLQPALLRLIKEASPAGFEARALAFGTSLYMLGHGAAPFLAGQLAPWIGLRGYFVVHAALVASGLAWWAARGMRPALRPAAPR